MVSSASSARLIQHLQAHAAAAARGYKANPQGYVRSGDFPVHFQRFAVHELRRRRIPPAPLTVGAMGRSKIRFSLHANKYVLGGYYPKEVDVWLHAEGSGPLLAISFKSMMTGVQQNINNRWEELIGDAANIHSRFPMLALGYIMVLPYMSTKGKLLTPEPLIDPMSGQPTSTATSIERKLLAAAGRKQSVDLASSYEAIALVVLDFSQSLPTVHPTFPDPALRIEGFFDRLVGSFRERNRYLP
ncbi:MAG TPA: hypothetical protein VH877_24235 [Polyangia bacterium]|jgi:hypothetical protein|nr:hypothetical protein [Polyangia bacterium]